MTKRKSPFNSRVKPGSSLSVKRKCKIPRAVLSTSQAGAFNRIDYVLPPLGSVIVPEGGFTFGGKNYINPTNIDIILPDPISEAAILSAGFTEDKIDVRLFNKVVNSDTAVLLSELSESDETYGISAMTVNSDVTLTIPEAAPLGSEILVENTDGINNLTVVVSNESESINGDFTGIVWNVSGGVLLKKLATGWIIASQHTI